MSDTKQQQQAILNAAVPLSNYDHRSGQRPLVSQPEDIVTDPTPAQRERIIYLVDDAIDTLEENLHAPKSDIRQKAADSILDRAGLSKNAHAAEEISLNIPAEAIVKMVEGLAKAFSPAQSPRDVSPDLSASYQSETEPASAASKLSPAGPPSPTDELSPINSSGPINEASQSGSTRPTGKQSPAEPAAAAGKQTEAPTGASASGGLPPSLRRVYQKEKSDD